MNVYFQLEFRKWLYVFTVSNRATPQLQLNVYKQCYVPNGNSNNLPSRFPFADDANFGDFTLLFWRRQLEMYKVKNARAELLFCSLDLFFATSSLPSPSWFARGKESIIFALDFLSKRCMHNEVCGCKEILLLNVEGKSRSSRKFSLFLSLKQT